MGSVLLPRLISRCHSDLEEVHNTAFGNGARGGLHSELPDSRIRSFVLFVEFLSHVCLGIPAVLTLPAFWLCLVCLNLPAQTPETPLRVRKTPQCSVVKNVCSRLILNLPYFYSALMSSEEPLDKINSMH